MKSQCIEAVTKAAGRALTVAEIKGIEDRIVGNMKQLARTDREAYSAMSEAERLQEAAKMASSQLVAEAVRKKAELVKNAQVVASIQDYIGVRVAKGDTNLQALDRTLAPKRDLQGGITSVEELSKSVTADLHRNLGDMLDATGEWGGLFENRDGVAAVIRELFGEDSGNPVAKRAAEAWSKAAEAGRKQFNDEGGNIGKLDNYHMPQSHDQMKVWKAGRNEWAAFMFGKLDTEKYVNIDGSLMTGEQIMSFLGHAWDTISSGGANSRTPGQRGSARRADKGSEHRQIHFKDADAFIEYQSRFGTGDPVELMFGHFNKLGRDIALVKQYGPNPDNMVQFLLDTAESADSRLNVDPKNRERDVAGVRKMYEFMAGHTEPVHSEAMKYAFDTVTGLHVASKLGSAVISAVNDQATLVMASHTVNMPIMKVWRNQLAAFNPLAREEKTFARRQGLMHESFVSEVNRWGTENLTSTWAGRLAGGVLKVSGLNAFTAAEKRSFGLGMYDLMGKFSREHETLASLHEADAKILERLGVSEATFQVWRKAETVSRNGQNDTVLTPDAIYAIEGLPEAVKRDAAQKLIGVALMDAEVAVPTPRARDRAAFSGFQRGTWKGEVIKQLGLFHATPYAMLTEHWGRLMAQDGGYNKTVYAAKYMTLTTLLGAFTMQLNEILQGKDPKDFARNPVRTGFAALLKGGGLGFYGDFFFSDTTLTGRTGALAGAAGPTAGAVESLTRLTIGNSAKAMQGKPTTAAADASAFAKSIIPGANLWYAKGVVNHLWMHYIQDVLQPGYSTRMEQRAQREFGQQFWWRPSETSPSRGPDLSKAVGG